MDKPSSKCPPLEWQEIEAAYLWHALGYNLARIARGMDVPRTMVLEQIYRSKRANYPTAKSNVWNNPYEQQPSKPHSGTHQVHEKDGMAGQEGAEL